VRAAIEGRLPRGIGRVIGEFLVTGESTDLGDRPSLLDGPFRPALLRP